MTQTFRILIVCTGNICRSPMAEQMLRQKFARANIENIDVSSAGVFAMVGESITAEVVMALTSSGYKPENHTATQATAEVIEQADLILTATTEHRAQVVRTFTRANRNTFTIKEFANLAEFIADPNLEIELDEPTDLHDKLRITAGARGYAPELADYDIADPYMLSQDVFDATRAELEPLLDSIVDWAANV